MKTRFIGHSGFFIELEHVCLLFDYYQGNLPDPIDKPIYIFASHFHQDHFNPVIFEYGKRWNEAHFVLATDIKNKQIPDEVKEMTTRALSNSEYVVDDLTITTFKSTDSGNAYLVEIEGKLIYHAGDLHLWLWDESKEDDEAMWTEFERQTKKLVNLLRKKYDDRPIDAAFLVLDPRQQYLAFLGIDYIMQNVKISRVYPMHQWGEFGLTNKLLKDPCSLKYRDRIVRINKEDFEDEVKDGFLQEL